MINVKDAKKMLIFLLWTFVYEGIGYLSYLVWSFLKYIKQIC